MGEKLLELKDLSIDYKIKDGYLSAVNKVNFTIDRGEVFAIVGESGCGKSTLAHSILRLLPGGNEIVTGEIHFKDEDLTLVDQERMEHVRGKEIGMIFQNPLDSLNPVFRVGDQIEEALLLDDMSEEDAYKRVIELFKDVKMPDAEERAKSFPHELSGGMRQRVMIAMMLSRNPELLIADEPTTALDVTIEAQILEILKQMKKEFNAAIMLITHNFGLVAEIADKIGVMYAGEMVEQGDVFEIFENPQHPYTKLLMKALPSGTKNDGRLQTIDGSVPRITEKKPECRFANRCPLADEKCRTENPPMEWISDTHYCKCFHLGEEEK
ncbi:MAG: ABC transporter ATP-binding protein [Clostridia bacterium]|nr:ABC transporter ATP-binding protein [Clostridia bacterium]